MRKHSENEGKIFPPVITIYNTSHFFFNALQFTKPEGGGFETR
jgi:hypothetical protein